MSANPDDELASATAAMQELGSLDRRLNAAKRRSEESAEKAAAARDRVAVEARDVERLESACRLRRFCRTSRVRMTTMSPARPPNTRPASTST